MNMVAVWVPRIIGYGVPLLMIVYTLVYVPVALYNEADCLSKGYPESRVTVGLERYCMTLDGTVTVKTERMSSP